MTTPDDSGVPDDFRPTNLEMLGETGCPGCDALIAKTKQLAEMIMEIGQMTVLPPPAEANKVEELEKSARWLLAEAEDE